jgi:hypothetical protein
VDGVCAVPNREAHIGSKNTPLGRVLGNAYQDCECASSVLIPKKILFYCSLQAIHEVRASIRDKSELPSARLISSGQRTLHVRTIYSSHGNLGNDLLIFYMKTVIFDIVKTLKEQTSEGSFGFDCCDLELTRFSNRHCMPIEIPAKDRVFRDSKCINYIRAMVTHDDCRIKEASIVS